MAPAVPIARPEDRLQQFGALPAPSERVRTVVVIPVRNEADGLPVALDALARQCDSIGRPFDPENFEILVLANNCTDGSAAIARGFAAERPQLRLHVVEVGLPCEVAHIGFVRRQLMDEAGRRLASAGRSDGVIASTDGDTRVAVDWLAATLREIEAGVDAVGGRIVTDGVERLAAGALRLQRLDAAHSLLRSRLASLLDPDESDPWPRHHQHYGASLAVTARAYRLVGGLPEVRFLEDEALVQALQRSDLRVRHSPQVRVSTSHRLDGRACVGLSWQLRQWAAGDPESIDPLVEEPTGFGRALTARAQLRRTWHRTPSALGRRPDICEALAGALGLPAPFVTERLSQGGPFGAIWDDLDQARVWARRARGEFVPRSQATATLRHLVRKAQAENRAPRIHAPFERSSSTSSR